MSPAPIFAKALQASFSAFSVMLIATFVLSALPVHHRAAHAEDLTRFFGSYVGKAKVENLKTGIEEERDLDIVVSPYRKDGLKIDWITVGLIDGRRDVPGVKRWSQTALFSPADNAKFMIEVGESSLFKEQDDMEVIEGDPVRWSRIEDGVLHACSFVVLEDGRYELQVYQRVLTDVGMDILFERIVDGEVIRRVSGSTVRAG